MSRTIPRMSRKASKKALIVAAVRNGQVHASTIVECRDGSLLCAFFMGSYEGARDVAIYVARLAEGAHEWPTPHKIADDPDFACWNPVLFYMGDVLVLNYKTGAWPDRWQAWEKISTDDGRTWTDPIMLPAGVYGPVRAKPIQCASDGKSLWIAGSSVETNRCWTAYFEHAREPHAWTRTRCVSCAMHAIQPVAWHYMGKMQAFFRPRDRRFLYYARSKDFGHTWSAPHLTQFRNPGSAVDVVRTKSYVVLAHNDSCLARARLALSISNTDGHKWCTPYVFDNDIMRCFYPALIESRDGALHVAYTVGRVEIRYQRFTVPEIENIFSVQIQQQHSERY